MKQPEIKKVLVIGSGPAVIGRSAEFDYAGTQALRTLKEEGLKTILINSNPSTVMTDKGLADQIYLEPLNIDIIKRIIEKEKPDSILPTVGGNLAGAGPWPLHERLFRGASGASTGRQPRDHP